MDLQKLIVSAVLSPDPRPQKQAEKQLMAILHQNPTAFVLTMSAYLSNKDFNSSLRQASGTILKRSLKLPQNYWAKIPIQNRNQIKDKLLGNLVTTDKLAKRASADCISCILSLQIPNNQWPTLIPVLVNNTIHQNTQIRLASIMTLGFICQQLKQVKQTISSKDQQTILAGIFKGMSKQNNNQIRSTSIKAFRDALAFMKGLLIRAQVRNLSINTLCQIISADPSMQLRQLSFMALFQICKHCYQYLDDSIDVIIRSTVPFITQGNQNNALRKSALQVWTTLASQYKQLIQQKKQVKNYSSIHQTEMIQTMIKNLLYYDADDDQLNGVSDSAQQALTLMGEFSSQTALNITINFISHTLNNLDDHKMRRAGLIAFISIMENKNKGTIQMFCSKGLGQFYKKLQDREVYVRQAAARLVAKIAQVFPQTIFGRMDNFQDFQLVLNSIKDQPRVMKNTCWTICYLAQALSKHSSNKFSQMTKRIIDLLLQNAIRGQEDKDRLVIDVCFMSIFNMVCSSQNNKMCIQYTVVMLKQLQLVKAKPANIKQQAYLFGILTFLHSCLMHFQTKKQQTQINKDLLRAVYQQIISLFKNIRDVLADGFYVISSVSSLLGIQFSSHFQQFWPYIQHALNRASQVQIIKSALGLIGDISRSIGIALQPKLPSMLKLLNDFICSQQFDRQGKISVFLTLADVIMNLKQRTLPYLPQILNIFNLGIRACIQFMASAQQQEYVDNLKQAIIESQMCVVHGLRSIHNFDQHMTQHFTLLVQFLKFINQANFQIKNQQIISCIHLVGDMLQFFKGNCKGIISMQLIRGLQVLTVQRNCDIKYNQYLMRNASILM